MSDDEVSILFITQHFPPETGAGPTRVDELCSRWADQGLDVTVLTSAPDYPEGVLYDGYHNEWVHRETRDDVSVVMTKTIPASSGGLSRRAIKFVWFMLLAVVVGLKLPRHDVVIATSPQPLTGVSAWIVARLKGSKFVFEVRDLWPESITSLTGAHESLFRPLDLLVRFLYRRADRIVTVSRAFEADFVDAGVDRSEIWYHPNGVTPEFFEREFEDVRIDGELVAEFDESFVVSYVGTIGRAHGLSVVLDAAAELEDVQFVLVGTGAETEELHARADRRGLTNVHFVGRRPKDQVPDFMLLSDISLVHLRDVELFRTVIPSKIFEAMAAGLPIALGVRGEAERIVQEADAGITFDPEDSEKLVEVVERLSTDPQLRRTLGENGSEFVDENHSWDSIAEAYEVNLRTLLRER